MKNDHRTINEFSSTEMIMQNLKAAVHRTTSRFATSLSNGTAMILKSITLVACLASITIPSVTLAQEAREKRTGFQVSIGAGVLSAPSYMGSDENQLSAFPNIAVSYGERFSASLRGVKYSLVSTENLKAGPVLSYDFGRDEDPDDGPFALSSNSSNDLAGLGDVDGTIKFGVFVEYSAKALVTKLELHQGIDGGYEGLTGEASMSYRARLNSFGRPIFLSIGPAFSFGGDDYNSALFDVSAAQSGLSGLEEFNAEGGFNSIGLHLSALMPLTRKLSIIGILNQNQLTGDVESSPIVSQRGSRDQTTVGVFFNYQFK